MCYTLYLSTDAPDDLAQVEATGFFFEPLPRDNEFASELRHASKWVIIGRYGGCSCHFRHWVNNDANELIFEDTSEWMPEDEEDVESTRELYGFYKSLLDRGCLVDVIDAWSGTNPRKLIDMHVKFSEVAVDRFRFLERGHFELLVS